MRTLFFGRGTLALQGPVGVSLFFLVLTYTDDVSAVVEAEYLNDVDVVWDFV